MTRLSDLTRARLAPLGLALGVLTSGLPLTSAPSHAADPDAEPAADAAPSDEGDAEPAAGPSVDLNSRVRVVQRRPILKAGRVELLAGAGLVLNDTMFDHWLATTTARVHVSEWISIGATYAKYFSSPSALRTTVAQDYEVYPELSALQWYAGADVTLVALDGKFLFFDSAIAYWDLYVSLGGGVTKTSRSDDMKPTGMVGAGLRFYFTPWLTVSFELRDHVFLEDFRAGSSIVNNVVGQAGLTLFIPFGFDYEYAK